MIHIEHENFIKTNAAENSGLETIFLDFWVSTSTIYELLKNVSEANSRNAAKINDFLFPKAMPQISYANRGIVDL